MDSIFNSKSGVPHIGEKILKCMDIKSIVNCGSVNQGLRSYMENYMLDLERLDFSKRFKSYLLKEISIPQELWLPLIEMLDEKKLWNHEVKKQFYLCMIRILHQENCFPRRIPSFKFSSWHMDEIIDSAIGKK